MESNDPFGEYIGPGIYIVGQYGVSLCSEDEVEGMVRSLIKLSEEDVEDEFDLDFDTGEYAEVYIERLDDPKYENDIDYIYMVCPILLGENVHFQQIATQNMEPYYGTGHSIFGSGNVTIKHKGKINYK